MIQSILQRYLIKLLYGYLLTASLSVTENTGDFIIPTEFAQICYVVSGNVQT